MEEIFPLDHELVLIDGLLSTVRDFISSSLCDVQGWRHSTNDSYFVASAFFCLMAHDFPPDRQIQLEYI